MKILFMAAFIAVSTTSFCTAQEKQIAITVDDLPVVNYGIDSKDFAKEIVNKILDGLDRYQVPAIGYVNEGKLYKKGKKDRARLNLLENWLQRGYELGNHTFSHMNYHRSGYNDYTTDIVKGEKVTRPMAKKYGYDLRFFRHPYLKSGSTKEKADSLQIFLHQKGYVAAPVTIDNDDYLFAKRYSEAYEAGDTAKMRTIGEAYVKHTEAKLLYFENLTVKMLNRHIRQVFLIHANLLNAHYLEDILKMFSKNGYTFISQEEALKDEVYGEEITAYGDWGISWIERWALSRGKRGDFFEGEPALPELLNE
ncbi:polysaccharide deacetylase-related protein [Fulvivirga imtechensis AK7]|uniref:Polysaccharide deacetylase-related protein n=1 Tax=Fulvivirga imtechensis AK7 TaxID=1237149 RepID=L8JHH8_9BACT|nr:polysaccharide deacetylase family protein [Fulvivirga imtechensis]ELR68296.1 polysaccharide deacetylase-related protein [Fulvivirga imtechensis AK7]